MNQPFHDHFSGVAARYADFRPRYPSALFEYLASLVPQASTVWDCAAGNGQASFDLVEYFERVIATDASAEQIASAPAHPRIQFAVATAEASGLPDKSVDLVTVAQALHWFDFDKFYAEVSRVLKPGGIIAVWDYGVNTLENGEVNHIVQNYYANVVGPYWPPERRFVEVGYRTIPFPFAEIAPPPVIMRARWTLAQLLGYFSTWSATSRYEKVNGRNPIEPLRDELAKAWGDPANEKTVVWPLALRVGRFENLK